jgi:hypothetical protein
MEQVLNRAGVNQKQKSELVRRPIRLRLDDHTQPFAKHRVVIDQQYPYGFRWWHIALPIKPSYISQSNDGKRLYRTLNHLRDGIWSHHGQQTALLEIELYSLNSLCLLRVAFTLSKLVLFVIGSPAQFRNRFRSLSNVNRSGSQNASKNAAAAAEKTE